MHDGISLSPKEGGNLDTRYNMNDPWGHDPQWKPNLCHPTYRRSLEPWDSQRQKVDSGGQRLGRGGGVSVWWGQSVSLGRWKVLEMLVAMAAQQYERTWCHWAICLKIPKTVNFMVCVFYNKNWKKKRKPQTKENQSGGKSRSLSSTAAAPGNRGS